MSRSLLAVAPRRASPFAAPLSTVLRGRQWFIASHRGPVQFRFQDGGLQAMPSAGGLASALLDQARQTPLTWFACATNGADRLAAARSQTSIPGMEQLRLRLIVSSDEALNWSYRRFANPVLWFLQHGLWGELRRPGIHSMVEQGWMLGYRPLNQTFARAIAQELLGAESPIVQVHDYHLYLVPRLLRRYAPATLIQHFTHIPWPEPSSWEPLPPEITRSICLGLLGADVIGFQTDASVQNFLRCCERYVPEGRISEECQSVRLDGRRSLVRAYPISVDPTALRRLATSAQTRAHREWLRRQCGEITVVRVDRLDPSKNVALGFRAFGHLLERRPDLIGRARFLAFLVPSRTDIAEYRRYAQSVWREVEAVNERFGRPHWQPITVFYENDRARALAGLSLADVVLVNSVADGMNLVAKEAMIVGERDPALVLSRRCGAYDQLGEHALSVPPCDLRATAAALEAAFEMPIIERRRRARALRQAIEEEDLAWWTHRQLEDLLARRG